MSRHHNRLIRVARGVLSANGVIVVNSQVGDTNIQGLLKFKAGKLNSLRITRPIADAITHLPHHWSVYLAVFCRDQLGRQYIQSVELKPTTQYKSDALADVMEDHHNELRASCNPAHIIGMGWIGCPLGRSFTDEQADMIFTGMGVWNEN